MTQMALQEWDVVEEVPAQSFSAGGGWDIVEEVPVEVPVSAQADEIDAVSGAQPPQKDTLLSALRKEVIQNTPDYFKMQAGGALRMVGEAKPFSRGADLAYADSELAALGDPQATERIRLLKESDPLRQVDMGMVETGQQMFREGAEAVRQNQPVGLSDGEQFAVDVARGTVNMGPAIATGLATGPVGALSVLGGQVSGQEYGEGRESGRSRGEAQMDAVANTLFEVIPETIPVMAILKKGSPLAKRAFDATLGEGAQEVITSLLEQTYDAQTLENMTLGEALRSINWKEAGYQGLVGAGVGGTLATAAHPFVGNETEQQQAPPPNALANPNAQDEWQAVEETPIAEQAPVVAEPTPIATEPSRTADVITKRAQENEAYRQRNNALRQDIPPRVDIMKMSEEEVDKPFTNPPVPARKPNEAYVDHVLKQTQEEAAQPTAIEQAFREAQRKQQDAEQRLQEKDKLIAYLERDIANLAKPQTTVSSVNESAAPTSPAGLSPSAPQGAVDSPNYEGLSSDELQKMIDDETGALEAQGVDVMKLYDSEDKQAEKILSKEGWKPYPQKLASLYKARDKADQSDLKQSISALRESKPTTVSDDEFSKVLKEAYSLSEGDVFDAYNASTYTKKSVGDWKTLRKINNILIRERGFLEDVSVESFPEFSIVSGPSEPLAIRPKKGALTAYNEETLRDAAMIYDAIAEKFNGQLRDGGMVEALRRGMTNRNSEALPPSAAPVEPAASPQALSSMAEGDSIQADLSNVDTVTEPSEMAMQSPKEQAADPITQAARTQPTKDKYLSYLRGRIGKQEFAKQQDKIEQAWEERNTMPDPALAVRGDDSIGIINDRLRAERTHTLPVLGQDAVKAVSERVRAARKLSPGLAIEVHSSEADFPSGIRATATEHGANGGVKAAYWRGKIHVNGSEFQNETEVEEAIVHEATHFGTRQLFGPKVKQAANNLHVVMGGDKGIKSIAQKYGVNLGPYFQTAATNPKIQSDPILRGAYLADELLAHVQAKKSTQALPKRIVDAVKNFIGAIREWLSRNGLVNLSKFNDADLSHLLHKIAKASQGKDVAAPEAFTKDDAAEFADIPAMSRSVAKDPWLEKNRRLREEDKTLWTKAKQILRRQLSPGGLLPSEVFDQKILRDSQFEVVEFDIRHLVGRLETAVKKDFGKRIQKLDDKTLAKLSEALSGDVDVTLPESTRTEIYAMRQHLDSLSREYVDILDAQVDAAASSFDEGEREIYGALLDAQDIEPKSDKPADKAVATKKRDKLVEKAKNKAIELWGDGKKMQSSMKKASDAASNVALIKTISNNMGEYVHRSYRAFDDPAWAKTVPDEVVNTARKYLIERYANQISDKVEGPPSPKDYAEGERKAEVFLHEILKNGTAYENVESFVRESKLGAKDLSVLKRRKKIAPEIRALLGEYKDPRINFSKSATKMGRLIWNQRFLDKVKEIGVDSFLFEGDKRPPEATKQISAEGSEVYAPLNGLWTYPEVDQAFKDALGKEQMANWYRVIVQLNGAVKFGKTVLSPTTAARNWQSAMFFALFNGHFNFRHVTKSLVGWREYVKQQGKGGSLRYLRKLKELGVAYDTPYAGEMMRLLEDSRIDDHLLGGGVRMTLKEALEYAKKFYQYGDDFWKIIGFENEKAMLIKYGKMTESNAEVEAAKRIRNTYPTYSMVGRGIQSLRRFPLVGTFVSFPAEIIRTTGNGLRYLYSDMKNPKLRPLAYKRLAGMAIASSFAYAAQEIAKSMLNMDDDEEEAIRRMAAPWQRNSNLVFTGRNSNGDLTYFDISFIDPYNYWKRPITAIFRDQPWEDAAADIALETLTPFFGADIAAQAIYEAFANKKESGGQVYKEHDEALSQLYDITNHLRKALQPGIASNLERTYRAMNNDVSPSGKKYDLFDEAMAWGGWRLSTLDPKVSLYYKAFEFSDAISDASRVLKEVAANPNEISDSDLESAYKRALKIRERAFQDMSLLVTAARNSGLSKSKVISILRNSNISIANTNAILKGSVPKWTPSEASRRSAVKKADALFNKDQANEISRRYRDIQRMNSSGSGD